MCRHCERLVEDVKHKQLVHDFMALSAKKTNERLLRPGETPITADDLNIHFEVTVYKPGMQPNTNALRLIHEFLKYE
jgi:hypothetical protein